MTLITQWLYVCYEGPDWQTDGLSGLLTVIIRPFYRSLSGSYLLHNVL